MPLKPPTSSPNSVVYVAVIGEFKRGKSSLINALLGDEVLPTGVTPVTAAPTLVRFGKVPRATVRLSDDTEIPIGVAELPDYITEAGNPGNRRGVREVVVEHPSPLLGPGIVLADTPGTGSVHAHNTQSTAAFLPRVDVALLVLSVTAPLSEAEAHLLTAVGETAARAAVCLNKVDLLSPEELTESLDFVTAQIDALTGGIKMPVFPVSARAAASPGDDGGLGAVRQFLSDVIVHEREQVVGGRARKVADGLVNLADAAIRLERAASSRPAARGENRARRLCQSPGRTGDRRRRGGDPSPRRLPPHRDRGHRAPRPGAPGQLAADAPRGIGRGVGAGPGPGSSEMGPGGRG